VSDHKPWSREWKDEQLFAVYEEWKDCARCHLSEYRTNVVFGMGNPDAKLLLVGEGPGEDEDETGEPFSGVSGQLLRNMLSKAEIKWEDIYVTNIIGCRATDDRGKNRDPSVAERDLCFPRLHQITYIVDPWIVVPVGKAALKALVGGRDWSVTEKHGQVFSSPPPQAKVSGDPNGYEVPGHVFPRKDHEKRVVSLEYEMFPILPPSYILQMDNYDEKKNRFTADGYAAKTVMDLKRLKKYLDVMGSEYSSAPRFERA